MSVTTGTDTYGRVKNVGGTPVVTKFVMLQFLPIYPLQSFYFTGTGSTETSGVPFIASSQTVVVNGIPLERVDRLSVAMAYFRGIFAALAVIGFMSIVPIIMHFTGEHLDAFALIAMRGLIGCFIVGIIGGALTYLIPLTPWRERQIRHYCGEALGICVDPARVSADTAVAIEEYVARVVSQGIPDDSRSACIQQLISSRLNIAQGIDAIAMERQTEEIMDRLNQVACHSK